MSLIDQCKTGIGMTARNVTKVMSGDKDQTRRIEAALRKLDDTFDAVVRKRDVENGDTFFLFSFCDGNGGYRNAAVVPKHQPGDLLYVKEALQNFGAYAIYKSNRGDELVKGKNGPRLWESDSGKPWKVNTLPARYMPKSAARTFIKITDVRCERIQDISYPDVIAEGVNCHQCGNRFRLFSGSILNCKQCDMDWDASQLTDLFRNLWNDTNGKGAWERNDWVFAYSFQLVTEASND